MKYLLRKGVGGLGFSQEGQEEYLKDSEIMEKILKESDLVEKHYKEWKRKRDEILNSGGVTRSQKRKLDREEQKHIKKLSAVEEKLKFMSIKNKKEIAKEVNKFG